jgi:integrase
VSLACAVCSQAQGAMRGSSAGTVRQVVRDDLSEGTIGIRPARRTAQVVGRDHQRPDWRERTEWADPTDLVCPSLGRADRPADAKRQGGFLHLGNWRVFRPASERAGLAGVIPYNGRDTFASPLIYEGRPPILVAAALGHGDTQTLWRHCAGSSQRPRWVCGCRSRRRLLRAPEACGGNKMFPRRSHAALLRGSQRAV